MARIETNVASLIAQNSLANSQAQLNTSLQRLSTGLRINSGADDPAGLIASQDLKSEIGGIQQAINADVIGPFELNRQRKLPGEFEDINGIAALADPLQHFAAGPRIDTADHPVERAG